MPLAVEVAKFHGGEGGSPGPIETFKGMNMRNIGKFQKFTNNLFVHCMGVGRLW